MFFKDYFNKSDSVIVEWFMKKVVFKFLCAFVSSNFEMKWKVQSTYALSVFVWSKYRAQRVVVQQMLITHKPGPLASGFLCLAEQDLGRQGVVGMSELARGLDLCICITVATL